MNKEEKLKMEVKELLSGDKPPIIIEKKVVYDKTAKQFVIKLPKDIVNAARLHNESKFKVVVNPNISELESSKKSHIIIYGK